MVLVVGQRGRLGDARSETVMVTVEGLVVRLRVWRRGVGRIGSDSLASDGCAVEERSRGLLL